MKTLIEAIQIAKNCHKKAVQKVNTLKNGYESVKYCKNISKDHKFLIYCLLNPYHKSYKKGYMVLSKREQLRYNLPAIITAYTDTKNKLCILPVR